MSAPKTSKPKKKKRGRPEKISPEIQELFCSALAAGNYLHTAAAYAGISRDTLNRWLKLGRRSAAAKKRPYRAAYVDGSGRLVPEQKGCRYRAFSDAVTKAMATAEVGHVSNVLAAAKGRPGQPAQKEVIDGKTGQVIVPARAAVSELQPQWQASAWWLERTRPQKFGRRVFRIEDADGGGAADPSVPPGPVIYLPAEEPLPGAPAAPQLASGDGHDRDAGEPAADGEGEG
jgi:hypothetical protein